MQMAQIFRENFVKFFKQLLCGAPTNSYSAIYNLDYFFMEDFVCTGLWSGK